MPAFPMKDVVADDVKRAFHASPAPREFSLPTLLAWRRGENDATITDASGKPLVRVHANAILAAVLHKDTWQAIERACKDHLSFLADETWELAAGVSNAALAERFLKKALIVTSLSDLDATGQLMTVMHDLTVIMTFPVVKNVIIDAIRRQLDAVDRVRRWVALLDSVAGQDETRVALAHASLASIIDGCTGTSQRRGFADLVARHPASKTLVGALLRSGSASEDLGVDVLGLLDTMDRATIDAFLATDARVVHRNYLLRLVCVRSNQVSTPLMLSALGLLLASNPWALERQFISWKRRISASILDRQRVEGVTSEIAQRVEKARRAMTFSPELAPAAMHTWQADDAILERGHAIARAMVDGDDPDTFEGIPDDIRAFLEQQLRGTGQAVTVVRARAGKAKREILPAGAKDGPWVCLDDGVVTGLGLSGLRLRQWPAFLEAMPGLRVLDASNNALKVAGPVAGLPALRYLDLSRNAFNDLSLDGPMDALSVLDLHGNALKRIDVSGAVTRLRVLDVSRNDIDKLAAIASLDRCEKLDACNIAWNRLGSLAGMPGLPKLTRLFASGNGMVRLDVEQQCPGLRHVDLSDNNLGALKGIAAFPALEHLDVSRNYLKHLKDVAGLNNLQVLIAPDNQVLSNDPLKGLPALATLDLRGNPLDEVPEEARGRLLAGPR